MTKVSRAGSRTASGRAVAEVESQTQGPRLQLATEGLIWQLSYAWLFHECHRQDPAIKNSHLAVLVNMSNYVNSWLGTYRPILAHSTKHLPYSFKIYTFKARSCCLCPIQIQQPCVFTLLRRESLCVRNLCLGVDVPNTRSRGEDPQKTIFLPTYGIWLPSDNNATTIYQSLFFLFIVI